MPGGFGDEPFGEGPFGLTDYGNLSLAKQIPPIYLQKDADIPGRPFLNFLEAMAVMVRSEKEFSDRFPLLQDPLAVRAEFLGLLGDNIGAFVQVEDADIIKRNEVLHAHTWFTTKELKAAYIAIARMNGLDAIIDEVFEVPCGSGNLTITPPHEFQFPPGLPPNAGTFPQDPVAAIPGTSPPFPLPGDDFVDDFVGVGVLADPPWETVTGGAGNAARNGAGQLLINIPAVADAAFVRLRDNYDRRAKFDTVVELDGIPNGTQLDPDTAFILAILQPPPAGNLGPKAHADAVLDRRVTAEADSPNGVFYLRVTTNLGPGGTPKDYYWDQANQVWTPGKIGVSPFSVPHTPYKFILRSHSQWFKWVVVRDVGFGDVVIADTKPFFWSDVLNNGMPMSLVMGDTSNDTGRFTQLLYGRFETALTEDCDHAKISCIQVQFFIPPPGSGAGTYFPPFGSPLDPAELAVILSNIKRKFAKVTPIHIDICYPIVIATIPTRFFQHFDVLDPTPSLPVPSPWPSAGFEEVDAAFTSADSHPMDATPGDAFTKPPWVAGVGVPDVYKRGQDGGWVIVTQVQPATPATAATAVITDVGKRRIAELLGGLISGPLSPGGANRSVRPVYFQLGRDGVAVQKTPDPIRTALEDATPYQQALLTVGLGLDINPALAPAFAPESTIQFHLLVPAGTMAPGTYREFGIFVQFGNNPPDLFVYGTIDGVTEASALEINIDVRV